MGGASVSAGIFSRYWSTGGGGEKYAGTVAEVLAERYDTRLLGVEEVDPEWLAERLHLDLAKVGFERLPEDLASVTEASAEVDLFVNVSYMSADEAAHERSIYVVMFPSSPTGHMSVLQKAVASSVGARRDRAGTKMRWGHGFHPRGPGRRAATWTDGAGTLFFTTQPGRPLTVEVDLVHQRPASELPVDVTVEVDGTAVAEATLRSPASRVQAQVPVTLRFDVESREPGDEVEVVIRSSTFVPAQVLGTGDLRRLGVPVRSIRSGSTAARTVGRMAPVLLTTPPSFDWLDSYGAVVSISEYTREWVKRWWGRDTEVLYPPVTMQQAGEKQPIILSVGRFFAADRGHSKKQLEMVRAFRSLCDQGVRGWTLHLVGGCADADLPYLDAVRREATGYPVEFHVDISGAELRRLYASASLYWHASGLGEHERRHPDRMEHFGITTVEAMSAGAVPVVIGLAGQIETVRHGVDGYLFSSLEGLVQLTRSLIDDEPTRSRMAASGEQRARAFSRDAFAERLWAIVDGLPPSRASEGPLSPEVDP